MMATHWRIGLALALLFFFSESAVAQRGSMLIKRRPQVQRPMAPAYDTPLANGFNISDSGEYSQVAYDGDVTYDDAIYPDAGCGPAAGYGDAGCCGECGYGDCGCAGGGCDGLFTSGLFGGIGCTDTCGPSVMTAGVELTFLHPHFESNVAVTQLESDANTTFETFQRLRICPRHKVGSPCLA